MTAIELAQELRYDAQKIKANFPKVQKYFFKKGIYIVRVGENEFGIQTPKEESPRFKHVEQGAK